MSNDETVDLDRLVTDVRTLAADSPRFVYRSTITGVCHYAPDDLNPQGCLLGAALARQGILVDPDVQESIGELLITYGANEGDWRVLWCSSVQTFQDGGATWSRAVTEATRSIRLGRRPGYWPVELSPDDDRLLDGPIGLFLQQ